MSHAEPPARPPRWSDPCAALVEMLVTNGAPSLPWAIEWSSDGRDPLHAAWAASHDGSAMAWLAAHTTAREPLVLALCECLRDPPSPSPLEVIDQLEGCVRGRATVDAVAGAARSNEPAPDRPGTYLPQATILRHAHLHALLDHMVALADPSAALAYHAERVLVHASALPDGTAFPMRGPTEYRRHAGARAWQRLARFAEILRARLDPPPLARVMRAEV